MKHCLDFIAVVSSSLNLAHQSHQPGLTPQQVDMTAEYSPLMAVAAAVVTEAGRMAQDMRIQVRAAAEAPLHNYEYF